MGLAHAVVGAIRPRQLITWTRADDVPEDLTGATLSGKIRPANTGETRAIVGGLVVTDGSLGIFRWDYALADVATWGEHDVEFTAVFNDQPSPARTIATKWTVYRALP